MITPIIFFHYTQHFVVCKPIYNFLLFLLLFTIYDCIILLRIVEKRRKSVYSFSKRLTDVRVEAGYSQKDLAKELNITASAYGYYEQGRNEPPLETVRLLAKKLNVSADYLIGLINEPKHPIRYKITDDFTLTDAELVTVKQLKEKQLLSELSKNPVENIDKLVRFWEFMNKETQEKG